MERVKKRKMPLNRTLGEPTTSVVNKASVFLDHSYSCHDLCKEETMKSKITKLESNLISTKHKLKKARQKLEAKKIENKNLKDILLQLKQERLITTDNGLLLDNILPQITTDIFKNAAKNLKRTNGRSYSETMKHFAMTLYFISPKAYDYMREKLCLPHKTTLQHWFQAINGQPGFTEEIFDYLTKVTKTSKRMQCSFIMDEMAIRKQICFDGESQVGYINYGTGFSVENDIAASEVLIFMIVSITESWKIPIGYFLITGLSSQQKAAFVEIALAKLHYAGIDILGVVCDGLRSNFAMFKFLGSNADENGVLSSFPHPITGLDIYPIFDACHMLKVLRNLFAEKKLLQSNGNAINWEFIVKLQNLQSENFLKLGNKLGKNHVQWYKQKMKVKLAAQTLSSSVASALKFLENVKMKGFQNSRATVEFIEIIDALFDALNSRNPFGNYLKSPVRTENKTIWAEKLIRARKMLIGLTYADGKLIVKSLRKTSIIGFCTTIDSMIKICNNLLNDSTVKYILTYKFSQDNLEVFFETIRSKGGHNNNPNSLQFRSAYRQVIINRIKRIPTGNTSVSDHIAFLPLHLIPRKSEKSPAIELSELPENLFHFLQYTPNISPFSNSATLYIENVVLYISGFVSRKVANRIECMDCITALFDVNLELINTRAAEFLKIKDNGGLSRPSKSVYRICSITEQCIRGEPYNNGFRAVPNMFLKLQCHVMQRLLHKNIFPELDEHLKSVEITFKHDDHVSFLKKQVIKEYSSVRLHHSAKTITERLRGDSIRSKLTKLIHFKHQ